MECEFPVAVKSYKLMLNCYTLYTFLYFTPNTVSSTTGNVFNNAPLAYKHTAYLLCYTFTKVSKILQFACTNCRL